MKAQEIRRKFLNYFKEQGHTILPSSPVIPHADPTLLFTNAGMNQFKDLFLGKATRSYKRVATSQKCVRVGGKHNDLDNVGHTSRHLTFFEMLGNFSFGDYFKREAIRFAWEVATQVFAFPEEKIWPTIFETDEEAFALWKEIVPEKRIVRLGEKDNFWSMGDTGPCGPCSELLFDRGPAYGAASSPKEDLSGERFLEFWNLVFMQFNRREGGHEEILPSPSIDTGAGLERIALLKQGVHSVFETDLFVSLIDAIAEVTGRPYPKGDPHLSAAYHVIADNIRSLSFAIADGAQPSNVERGYILRKLLRRAVRYGRMLGTKGPFLAQVLPRLIELMGDDYKELPLAKERIAEILTTEEEAFLRTLQRGGGMLQKVIEQAQKNPLKQISGEEVFKLKDTYGLPLEELLLIAKDTGLTINLEAFELLEEKAKELSRSKHVQHAHVVEEGVFKAHVAEHGACTFTGYTEVEGEGTILALFRSGEKVSSLTAGDTGIILLSSTPFYAEMGGQVGDTGILSHQGARFCVTSCTAPSPGVIAHIGVMEEGSFLIGEPVKAFLNTKRRGEIAANHTATHLLHFALQQVLGDHIRQAGSLVDATHFRFDFNHHKALSKEELRQIERCVNSYVREDLPVKTYELSYEQVQTRSDIKQFFGEKYGSTVRVVDMGKSKELCGGTHACHVGKVGLFKILKESSIAAGVRRIEAVTGEHAEALFYAQEDLLETVASSLKTPPQRLLERLTALQEEHKKLSEIAQSSHREKLRSLAEELISKIEHAPVPHLTVALSVEGEDLREIANYILNKVGSLALLLGCGVEGKVQLVARITPDLIAKGYNAALLLKEIAPIIEGSGGGKPDAAQAGGKKFQGLKPALDHGKQWLLQK